MHLCYLIVVAICINECLLLDHAVYNLEFRDYRSSKRIIAKTHLNASQCQSPYSCTQACTMYVVHMATTTCMHAQITIIIYEYQKYEACYDIWEWSLYYMELIIINFALH